MESKAKKVTVEITNHREIMLLQGELKGLGYHALILGSAAAVLDHLGNKKTTFVSKFAAAQVGAISAVGIHFLSRGVSQTVGLLVTPIVNKYYASKSPEKKKAA